jgi:predicted Zn-dependent peptidase
MYYDFTTLPNGLRVITETMPSINSVALGIWFDTGSRDESVQEHGASHFLEHLLFKGSEKLSAKDIADAFDAVGAQSNAFTSKEYTAYWARTRDADLPLAMDLLGEMVQRPAFRLPEIDSERNVILEEINMNEDDPSDTAYEQFMHALWGEHPLAREILGTRQSITGMDRDTIHGYWARRYGPGSSVVALAGNASHEDVVALAADVFADWEGGGNDRELHELESESRVLVRRRDTEQAHLVIGGTGFTRDDDRRFAHIVLDHVMGGGMSSRLFSEIREKRGLAYAVHSFRLPFTDSGGWAVFVGTTPHQTKQVFDLIEAELEKVCERGLQPEELDRAKGHVEGSLALANESPNARMTRLGRTETTGSEHLTIEETVRRIEAVDNDAVIEVANAVYRTPRVVGAVGPFEADDLQEHLA